MTEPIRVLVVDDSAFMRQILTDLLTADGDLVVIGAARDGKQGLEMALDLRPDVITLDLEMPRVDGFATLRELMERCPIPVVMVSSHTQEGAVATIRALTLGAVDFVPKPSGSISLDMVRVRAELVSKVKAAAQATPQPRRLLADLPERLPLPPIIPLAPGQSAPVRRVVVIGTSTGGPGALHQVIPRLPAHLDCAVLVVQHMPPGFTRSLASRLAQVSAVPVREAADGEVIRSGQVLIAPGGQHMLVHPSGCVQLTRDRPVHGLRPAVDKTMTSAVKHWGAGSLGILLTGMGTDGVMGLAAVRMAGGRTLAEHPSTCVVYGMPRAAVDQGLADRVLPIGQIADAIVAFSQEVSPLRPERAAHGGASH